MQKKLSNFWYYYKVYVIIAVACVILIISSVVESINSVDPDIQVMMVNIPDNAQLIVEETIKHPNDGVDPELNVFIDTLTLPLNSTINETTYTSLNKILVRVASGEIDLFIADYDTFQYYAYQNYFIDLQTVFSEGQIDELMSCFSYMDISYTSTGVEAGIDLESYLKQLPNSFDTSIMNSPVPIGIVVEYPNMECPLICGIPVTSERQGLASSYILKFLNLDGLSTGEN